MNEKIMKRAKALLAMSQDASSENEAMIAAKRLHSLLAKYNISLTQLEDKLEQPDEEFFNSVNWPWRRTVLKCVSELYFCKCYYSQTRKNYADYYVIGTEVNRMFALGIIKNIFNIIEVKAKQESVDHYGKANSTFISSFRNGAASRINARCNELIGASKSGKLQDEDGTNLPALLSVYEQNDLMNKDFMEDLGLITKKTKTRAHDRSGYTAGQKAGDKVQLSRELQNKQSPKLLGN